MDVSKIEHSISRKLLYVLAVMFVTYAALMIYTVLRLKHVGDEIALIQDQDLPILHKWSDVSQAEYKRHLLLQELHLERIRAGLDVEKLSAYQTRYQALTDQINAEMLPAGVSVPAGEDSPALYQLLEEKHKEDGKKVVQQFQGYQDSLKTYSDPFFESGDATAGLEQSWKKVEEILDDLEELIASEIQLILRESEAEAKKLAEDEKALIQTVILCSLALLVLSAMLLRNYLKQITEPLAAVTEQSIRIAKGDLTGESVNVKSRDELAVLATAFQTMQERLRNQIREMQQSTDLLAASIQQTSASIEEQASSTKEEAATIQEITATMQEIQQSGTEIAQRATQLQDSAQQNLKESEDGLSAVEATSGSMVRIREQIEEVAEKIVNLSEKTQAIGDIVTTVNDIAEQSNILAINASIEAAGAGESGGRFSIVAREMKNLADQAKDSTRQVRSILGEIQKGINSSVMLTEEAVKRSEAGKQHSIVADQTIRSLLESSQANLLAFQQILAGTNQQQIGVDQVAQGMQDIRMAVDQTVAGISELEQATQNLKTMSEQMKTFIQQYQV